MSYTFSKIVGMDFDEAKSKVTDELKKEGFGVLTEIDIKDALKKKIDVDFRRYTILGACNPQFAHKALSVEHEIGSMLPCNVVVQQMEDGSIKVSAIDPVASMMAVKNDNLGEVATQVREKLKTVINNL
ncbi:MAG: DUF302 domain-containing protein [Bacteroidia bacterium]|jgi:uncharacterized protein (DUF302 family)|nr:DUF302 domain-containing protein [Bacteroidia bacterium]MCO5253220.1 DUF302 domain-containing protein [Bacteroidota bacterium]MCZ2128831.1 DUF302 domain-containing protein [Bacteroidia bacterium]